MVGGDREGVYINIQANPQSVCLRTHTSSSKKCSDWEIRYRSIIFLCLFTEFLIILLVFTVFVLEARNKYGTKMNFGVFLPFCYIDPHTILTYKRLLPSFDEYSSLICRLCDTWSPKLSTLNRYKPRFRPIILQRANNYDL